MPEVDGSVATPQVLRIDTVRRKGGLQHVGTVESVEVRRKVAFVQRANM